MSESDYRRYSAAVSQVICSITAKRDWQGKIRTETIVSKWRQEAAAQGLSGNVFDAAIGELRSVTPNYLSIAGIAYRDGLIPPELMGNLREQLDLVFAKSVDCQPDTNDTVINLMQPSMFPYVKAKSFQARPAPQPEAWSLRPLGHIQGEVHEKQRFRHCVVGVPETSIYQWLPAEVDVDAQGAARIASYVNNAPDRPALYEALEAGFSCLLPLFEHVVTPPGARQVVNLKNRRLQVVVKAANCVLKPGQSYEGGWHVEGMQHERIVAAGIVYYGTSQNMHGAGLSFRRLLSRNVVGHRGALPDEDLCEGPTVSYAVRDGTFQSVSVGDGPEVSKMQTVEEKQEKGKQDDEDDDEDEDEEDDEDGRQMPRIPTGFVKPKYRLSGGDVRAATLWDVGYKEERVPNHVELGSIATPCGRCLAFKNSLQHKVELLWNGSDTETVARKVLIFWLVDPDQRILSTLDVPRQQWDQLMPLLATTLRRQWRPVEGQLHNTTVARILQFAKWGFTNEEALRHREALMKERRFQKIANLEFEKTITRAYSFCEH